MHMHTPTPHTTTCTAHAHCTHALQVRAYAAALAVYSRKGWTHVEDHVHFTLGRNCATLGKVELALQFFLRLLGHSRQPADRQQTFMKEFGNILRLNPQHASLPTLPVPRFSDRTIKVLLGDNARGPQSAGPEALTDNAALWKALVTPLKGREAANAGGNWLQKSAVVAAEPTYAPCVQGEWVYVEVEVDNPMHVPLQLSTLKLACTHTPAAAATGNAADAGAPPAGTGLVAAGAAANLELDEHELTLAPGKRSVVRLGVRPLAEGTLVIAGASWTLGGMVHGRHDFALHGRRLNDTRQQRIGKEYAFDQSLRLEVVGPMPLLQAAIEGMPASLLLGQVVLAKLVLTNGGRTPLTALRLRLSHPSFCVVAEEATPPTAADAAQQAAAAVSGLGLAGTAVAAPPLFRERTAQAPPADWATVALPLPGGELQPGCSCTLPLWLRAATVGAHALHFVFCYEAATPHRLLKRRLCPISAQLSVEPSLTLRHFLRPAHACAHGESYVLGISALNAARRPGLRLLPAQASCVSSAWQMTPLTAAGQRTEPLSPGEEFSLYFSLTRAPPATTAAAAPSEAAATAAAAPAAAAAAAAAAAVTRVVHSELSLAGQAAIDSRALPHTSFLLRDSAPSTTVASVAAAASRGSEAPARRRKKGEVVLVPELAAVVLHFSAEDGTAAGQLHLTGLLPQPLAPPAPNEQAPKRPKPAVVALWTDAARDEVRTAHTASCTLRTPTPPHPRSAPSRPSILPPRPLRACRCGYGPSAGRRSRTTSARLRCARSR